jgi:D-hydroxyproline dehydrogenase subunit alpha
LGGSLEADVAVVGAGPAGIAAACAACDAGGSVVVVDEQPAPGGQIWRRRVGDVGAASRAGRAASEVGWASGEALSAWSGAQSTTSEPGPTAKGARSARLGAGHAAIAALDASPATVLSNTAVWATGDDSTLLTVDAAGVSGDVWARAIVVATGAHDRPVAFPGWTLPGVMTAGGAQALAKAQGLAAGRRVVLAGAGPFLLPVARELVAAGATVVAVAEATRRRDWLRHAPVAARDPVRLREYGHYRRALNAAGVEFRWGHVVVRADGGDAVRSVMLAPCDCAWRPNLDRARTYEADALCTAYGFVPSVELARSLGCALTAAGAVRCDDDMRTTVPHVFAAGEPTGIGGAELASAEGAIAGCAAAAHARGSVAPPPSRELDRKRRRQARFAAMLADLFAPRPGLWELAAPDTVLCRCEDVTLAEIRAAAAETGDGGLSALKMVSRCGQGPCQGRTCAELVARAAARGEQDRYSVRPPLRPVTLGTLAAVDEVSAPRS